MGVSLARLTGAAVVATDISAKALQVAAYNAAQQNVDVSFLQHDITTHPLPAGGFDWVVSNPPYISEAERDGMKANVLNYEPHLALFVPGEPLLFYRHIAARSKPVLKAGGHVAVEINEHFAKEVMAVFAAEGYTAVQCLQDISGKDRMVVARMA
jgi:release factor glutamine methyltransferase